MTGLLLRARELRCAAALAGLLAATGCGGSSVPADAGPKGDAVHAADAGGCPAATLEWKTNGGMVAFRYVHKLVDCRAYSMSTDPAGKSCQATLAATDPVLLSILGALRSEDVRQSLLHPGALYGSDPRPADGTVLEITVDGKNVLVGGDCDAASTCTPVPPGLAELRNALVKLASAQLARPECK